jgi:hypothetical protein
MYKRVVRGEASVREHLVLSGKLLAGVAAAWAVGTSVFVATARVATPNDQLWFQAHGPFAALWLFLFCGLYLLAARFAWRGNHAALASAALAAVALSVITGFSVGGAYLPAAIALGLSALVLTAARMMEER